MIKIPHTNNKLSTIMASSLSHLLYLAHRVNCLNNEAKYDSAMRFENRLIVCRELLENQGFDVSIEVSKGLYAEIAIYAKEDKVSATIYPEIYINED